VKIPPPPELFPEVEKLGVVKLSLNKVSRKVLETVALAKSD
jgi:hypothetical protein